MWLTYMRVLGESLHECLVSLIFQHPLAAQMNHNVRHRLRTIVRLTFGAELGVDWMPRECGDQGGDVPG